LPRTAADVDPPDAHGHDAQRHENDNRQDI